LRRVSRGAAPRFIFRDYIPQYGEQEMSDQSGFGEEGENCGLLPICHALEGKAVSEEENATPPRRRSYYPRFFMQKTLF